MDDFEFRLRNKTVGEFPRRLAHRNPFDDLDAAVAMDIVFRLLPHAVTPETENQLSDLGITRRNNRQLRAMEKVKPDTDTTLPVICAFFKIDQKMLIGAKKVSCSSCKTMLIANEQAPGAKVKYLCCFCVADRALEQYWLKKDRRKKKG